MVVDFFSYVGGVLSKRLSSLLPSLLIPDLHVHTRILRILPQKPPGRISTPNLRDQSRRHVSLLQLPGTRIEILVFEIFHDGTKGYVSGMVVDASSATGEDVVLIERGDGSPLARLDVYSGRWDGSSFGSWHFILLFLFVCLRRLIDRFL